MDLVKQKENTTNYDYKPCIYIGDHRVDTGDCKLLAGSADTWRGGHCSGDCLAINRSEINATRDDSKHSEDCGTGFLCRGFHSLVFLPMSDIQTGETFADGQTFTGARANKAVNEAVIKPDFVDSKELATPVAGDHLVFRQASSGLLKKTTVTSLNNSGGNVTSVGLSLPTAEYTVTGSPVNGAGTLTGTRKPQSGNKVFASPADGSSGTPSFRVMVAKDLYLPSALIAAAQIDWSLSDNFYKSLTGGVTFTFLNVPAAGAIYVKIIHNLFVPHWPAIAWPGASEPNYSVGTTIFKFMVIAGVTYGWVEATNL